MKTSVYSELISDSVDAAGQSWEQVELKAGSHTSRHELVSDVVMVTERESLNIDVTLVLILCVFLCFLEKS